MRALAAAWTAALALPACALAEPQARFPSPDSVPGRLQIGIGDRLMHREGERWVALVDQLDALDLRGDLIGVWLLRGWQESWIARAQLARVHERGMAPVVLHYFFAGAISAERIEAQRDAWHASLKRMARQLRAERPVYVVLEPEFNVEPPPGETAVVDWPGFADELRTAAELVRREAPNARVGTCPGDFAGRPDLERSLGEVAADLDFLAFQEMRARTRAHEGGPGYLEVARASVDYAAYLKRAFGRPVLLAYAAISSYGGWEAEQARVLRELAARERTLREVGVFGVLYFQLNDDPEHAGYFGSAEREFGLIDARGQPKPGLSAYRELLAAARSAARPLPPAARDCRPGFARHSAGPGPCPRSTPVAAPH